MYVKTCHLAPAPCPYPSQTTVPHGCGWNHEEGLAFPWSLQKGPYTCTYHGQA